MKPMVNVAAYQGERGELGLVATPALLQHLKPPVSYSKNHP